MSRRKGPVGLVSMGVPPPLPQDVNMALAAARLKAALGPCAHPNAVPVELLLGGEIIAWLCPSCDAQLSARWKLT